MHLWIRSCWSFMWVTQSLSMIFGIWRGYLDWMFENHLRLMSIQMLILELVEVLVTRCLILPFLSIHCWIPMSGLLCPTFYLNNYSNVSQSFNTYKELSKVTFNKFTWCMWWSHICYIRCLFWSNSHHLKDYKILR